MNDLEQQFAQAAARPQLFGDGEVDPTRVAENLHAVHAELDAPREPRLARLLRRLGVPDLTIPLVTATPALRRSWLVAVAIAVLFSLSVASGNTGGGVDRIAVFLTLAPLVPLLGVACCNTLSITSMPCSARNGRVVSVRSCSPPAGARRLSSTDT